MKKFISVLMAAMLMVTAAVPVTAMAAPAEPAAASLIAPACQGICPGVERYRVNWSEIVDL